MHSSRSNQLAAWAMLATDAAEEAATSSTELPARSLSALVLLTNRPGSSVNWLVGRLGLTQSGTVRLVQRLVGLGLVSQRRVAGREVSLQVTAAGSARLERALRARAGAVESLLAALSPTEQDRLAALAGKALRGGTRGRDEADVVCRLCDWDACGSGCPVDASVAPAEPGTVRGS